MKRQLLLLTFGILAFDPTQYLQAQTVYDESTPASQLPDGMYYQGGPGANNTYNWAYPFGTKLTIKSNGGNRTLEILADNKANSNLRFRQYNINTGSWTSWEHIITAKGNAEVNGGLSLTGQNPISSINGFNNVIQLKNPYNAAMVYNPGEATELMFGFHASGNFYWGDGNANTYSMILTKTGAAKVSNTLSIGGDAISGYRLTVYGKAVAKEIKVTLDGWSDHVFKDKYPLMPIKELDQYIQVHRHLPGIPTEAEVLKEGVNLGKMNAKLLEKIEELTLYIIEQDRQLIVQKQQLEQMKKSIDDTNDRYYDLQMRLLKLENESAN